MFASSHMYSFLPALFCVVFNIILAAPIEVYTTKSSESSHCEHFFVRLLRRPAQRSIVSTFRYPAALSNATEFDTIILLFVAFSGLDQYKKTTTTTNMERIDSAETRDDSVVFSRILLIEINVSISGMISNNFFSHSFRNRSLEAVRVLVYLMLDQNVLYK